MASKELAAPCDLPEEVRAKNHQNTGAEGSPAPLPDFGYEYLDHTADIQLHSWGPNLSIAFEQCCVAMFGYITELEYVVPTFTQEITTEGDDLLSLLFHLLDEFLFLFSADPFFIPREVKITHLDIKNFKVTAIGRGETFDISKHPQGAEVKAITYSNMQVINSEDGKKWDCYVIVDI
ncbi:Protein archease-like [Oopsacas minuta]|uniref:Protein archease-like n=1 Tax=Oopsacas minuta TaxID=111878 RepID=A0AAV7JT51_9METZ|nr:Protein archease-like [Oopsacas minuta]